MITLLELIACALALCYIYLLSLRVDLGLISLLVADLITTAVGDKSQIFGGMHLGPFDVVSICLLCAGIIRTGKAMKRINATRTIAVGYLALFAISLGRGLYENGLLVAANESRGFIGPLVAMLYFLTSPADEKSIRRYTLTYLYFGAALCVVAVLAAAGLPLGINALSSSEITGLDGRYLPASAAVRNGDLMNLRRLLAGSCSTAYRCGSKRHQTGSPPRHGRRQRLRPGSRGKVELFKP